MTKNRDDRYRNMEEVMGDLKEVRIGRSPLLARQKFNVEALEQLEEGLAIESTSQPKGVPEEVVATYRMWVIVLGALSALLALAVLFILIGK